MSSSKPNVMPKKYEREAHVKQAVKAILDAHGWFWWMPAANGMGTTGVSDFCALKAGCFIAIETKFGKNPATPLQKAFLTSVRATDNFAFLVSETTVDYLKAYIEAFDRATEAAQKKRDVSPEDGAMMLNAIRVLSDY